MSKSSGLIPLKKQFPRCFQSSIEAFNSRPYGLMIEAHSLFRAFSGRVRIRGTPEIIETCREIDEIIKHLDNADVEIELPDEPSEPSEPTEYTVFMEMPACGYNLMYYIMNQVQYAFNRTKCQCVVVMFDDHKQVPLSKHPTQRKRHATSSQNVVPYKMVPGMPVVEWNVPVPDWKSVNANPEARYRAIEDVVEMIKERYPLPPKGRSIILDYGNTPVRISASIPGRWELAPEFSNTIGEGEIMLIMYSRHFLVDRNISVLTSSSDTDCLYLHLIFRELLGYELGADHPALQLDVMHRFKPRRNKDDPHARFRQVYCNIRRLTTEMQAHFKGGNVKTPLTDFSTAMNMAGCDYVEGLYKIKHESFYHGYMRHWRTIGPLLVIESPATIYDDMRKANKDVGLISDIAHLDIRAVKLLVKAAVIESKWYKPYCLQLIEPDMKIGEFRKRPVQHRESVDMSACMQTMTYEHVVKLIAEHNNDPKAHLPNLAYISARLWWYMLYNIGEPFGIAPDCMDHFGWTRNEDGLVVAIEDEEHVKRCKAYVPPQPKKGRKRAAGRGDFEEQDEKREQKHANDVDQQ